MIVIDQATVIEYFNQRAPSWEHTVKKNTSIIDEIFEAIGLKEGQSILDVACGSGALFEHYLKRNVASITAVDISPAMIAQARFHYPNPKITTIVGDIERLDFDQVFDHVVVFNALPHFPNPTRLIAHLSRFGNRVTIAHNIGRKRLNALHDAKAHSVSTELIASEILAQKAAPFLDIDQCQNEDNLYVVSGITKKQEFSSSSH